MKFAHCTPKYNNMKSTLILLFSFLTFISTSQIQVPGSAGKKCYERSQPTPGSRNVIWECGKIAGIADCNEKLAYDEASNTILSAQDGSPFSGTCETCFSNGILERRITFVNGKESGKDTTNYKSGCLQVVRSHIGGEENGQWLYFYDSTQQLAWEMNYLVGEKHGKCIYFTKSGDTTLWENYNRGLLNGTKKSFYADSKLEKEVNYSNGNLDGSFKVFSLEGNIVDDIHFKMGQKDGNFKYYYNDGSLMKTENWSTGIKNGEFKILYIQGHIQSFENYKKGLKEGVFEEYYTDKVLRRRAIYKKDVLLEEHIYNELGEETYSFGVLDDDSNSEDDIMPYGDNGRRKKRSKKKED